MDSIGMRLLALDGSFHWKQRLSATYAAVDSVGISIDRIAIDIGRASIFGRMASNCFAPFDLDGTSNELSSQADIGLRTKFEIKFQKPANRVD